jgi:superfamily II DNA or RNA helicase
MGDVSDVVSYFLSEQLSYKVEDSRYILKALYGIDPERNKDDEWDGIVKLYWKEKGHLFFTGMMAEVRKILTANQVEFTIEDRRTRPAPNLSNLVFDPKDMEDRPYEEISVQQMLKATRGVLQAATGAGKTFMVTELIGRIKTAPFLFLVLSKDLMQQAHETLSKHLSVPIGMIGDGMVDIQGVNVVMMQTAVKALHWDDQKFDPSAYKFDEEEEWDDDTVEKTKRGEDIRRLIINCKGIYLDECHHASSKTSQEIMSAARDAYWRFGGSATPFREDGAEKMIQALFGKVLVQISASWLIQNKYLVKPYIFNISIKEDRGDWKSWPQVYKHHIADNASLNDLVVRIENHLKALGIPLLVLVQRYPHGETLAKRTNLPFIKGKMPRKKRKEAIQELRDGVITGAIATTLADEGLDVKRLGAVAVAGGGKSITRVYQRVGRTLRTFPGKERALVFLFHHKCRYLDHHGIRVRHILKQEPEFVLMESTPESIIDDIDHLVRPTKGLFDD